MKEEATRREPATKHIWLRFAILIPLVIAMAIVCYVHIRSVGSTYDAWTPPLEEGKPGYNVTTKDDVKFTNPGVVEIVSVDHFETGAARITLKAVADGETGMMIGKDQESPEAMWSLRVVDGIVLEGGANFSGWEIVHLCVCVFLGVTSVLFASVVVRLKRFAWYGYEMVAAGGALLFTLFQTVLFAYTYLHQSLTSITDMSHEILSAADYFVLFSFIPMAVMALLVSISNISLIRHEGKRPANLLGIGISVVWLAAMWAWSELWNFAVHADLSFEIGVLLNAILTVGIIFGECLLVSTIVCAWLASRHVPAHGADYLVILGCGLREDGTPCPLLAGRVDRALEFDVARTQAGDAPATFVPSGGQGPDEIMSEAESMRNYLVEQGVDGNRVVLEDRSATTRENMAFARKVIEAHAGRDISEVTVAFSTTNYHVFRGYVCAHQAGMTAEGMGSKTRAYFWPNAFLREFAGLLAAQWRGILQTYLILAIIYVIAQYIVILA